MLNVTGTERIGYPVMFPRLEFLAYSLHLDVCIAINIFACTFIFEILLLLSLFQEIFPFDWFIYLVLSIYDHPPRDYNAQGTLDMLLWLFLHPPSFSMWGSLSSSRHHHYLGLADNNHDACLLLLFLYSIYGFSSLLFSNSTK